MRAAVRDWKAAFARFGPTLHVLHGPAESVVVTGPLDAPERLVRLNGAVRAMLLKADTATPERKLLEPSDPEEGPPIVGADLYARFLDASPGARDSRGLDLWLEPEPALRLLQAQGLVISEAGASLALPLVCSEQRVVKLLKAPARTPVHA
jgi:hypothetical protein